MGQIGCINGNQNRRSEVKEQFTFFWNGPFSQWYASQIIIGSMKFNCTEQFMMFCKAMLFDDIDTAKKIMKTRNPYEQKKLGRKVERFNIDRWNNVARSIVYVGNYYKYTQHIDLKNIILSTKGTCLVEASPKDRIWGIGLSEENPLAKNRSTWLGTNWLGETLNKVRDHIESGYSDETAISLCCNLIRRFKNG